MELQAIKEPSISGHIDTHLPLHGRQNKLFVCTFQNACDVFFWQVSQLLAWGQHGYEKVLLFPLGIAIAISVVNPPNRAIALAHATSSRPGTPAGSTDKGYKLTL
jgi:hypothetical protein